MSIEDLPLSIVVYPSPDLLLNHQHADHLATFINNAYYERNKDRLIGDRVRDKDDLVSQLGETSLVVLISAPSHPPQEEPMFYALGSARPYLEPEEYSVMGPQIPRDEAGEFERWELKVICTNPHVSQQGLGVLLMDMLELAIKRRIKATQHRDGATRRRRPQIVLSAVREITGEFYKRRGFEVCNEVHVGKGQHYGKLADQPNPDEFHIISMTKLI